MTNLCDGLPAFKPHTEAGVWDRFAAYRPLVADSFHHRDVVAGARAQSHTRLCEDCRWTT